MMTDQLILLIYNPVSGNKTFINHLDYFIQAFQERNYLVHPVRTNSEADFENILKSKDLSVYSAVFVAGGDGSVNLTASQLMKSDIDIPLGIIPAGTVNDISYNLGIPQNINQAIEALAFMHVERFDIGKANDRYFLNSCGAGLFMDIPHTTDRELKSMLGRIAYYIKGISELPNFSDICVRITDDSEIMDEKLYLFLVVNGKSAGGFRNIALSASMQDGLLDFIGIKACPINDLSFLFAQILMGNYISNKNVIYFKSKKITVECPGDFCMNTSDVDGEEGPNLPLEIECHPGKIQLIVPKPI
ncbi:MAG: YegS/Rv2252/BmrU family lipid kinase [Eubacteriaceae bacterium]|nr:YegS/Rv2252/BmrU family lipid kinase [Eubacteriaceae bacterium]